MDPRSTGHVKQLKNNRDFLAEIPPDYPDWIVTVVFYTALHAVDALLARDQVPVTSHVERNRALMHTHTYSAIAKAYMPLYGLARTVRYLAQPKA